MVTGIGYSVPVVAHHLPPVGTEEARAERLADRLVAEDGRLHVNSRLTPLLPRRIAPEPALHLDDLSTIPLLEREYRITFLQDRARLRAGDGDYVATATPPDDAWETYCEQRLGLGNVTWLRVAVPRNPLEIAAACWTDRRTRQTLVSAIRAGELRYIHPHMGCASVWALGQLLHRLARRPLQIIAPPPYLTRRVNDKAWFSDLVARLLGRDAVLPGAVAWNYSTLARLVAHAAGRSRTIVVKVPDSAGGVGNLVLPGERFRNRSLGVIRQTMRGLLTSLGWDGAGHLLVGSWETDVLCAPSSQLWIPPEDDGEPLVEGVFEQLLEGEGNWVGSVPAQLPGEVLDEIVSRSWLVARLLQRLRYVGRCSFDLLLTGASLDRGRLRFVECNGRWGGTSLPMTLMNRLVGDWRQAPYAARELVVPGAQRLTTTDLLIAFEDDLYDAATGRGRLVFYNPGALQHRPGIAAIGMGETWAAARRLVEDELPDRMRALLHRGP